MSKNALELLEQAKQRVEGANTRRQRIQVQLESARQQYAEAVGEAETNYGTADLAQLRAILVKQEADNEKAIMEFVHAVNGFENFIERIEKALADPEAMTALLSTMPEAEPAAPPVLAAATPAVAGAGVVAFNEDDI